MNIGHKIRDLRKKNGLTLEELASRSEVTKGFLSQLERDLTSPNLSALEDILEALGTSLKAFFNEDDKEEKIVFKKEDVFIDERKNEIVEWIVPNAQKNAMEPIKLTLHAGCKTSLMTHNGEEFGYILKGSLLIVSDNRKYRVNAKETFYLSGYHSHYLYNPLKRDTVFLWITTPPQF
ncbi:helix-turn-helix domain-containing protein [Eggerthia catenaformis]|uniref:helix-turn-helix domain-containing protein n=1 Tax=Eggerthia catenaformis TaxID=31973 RepID=UPI0028ED4CCD|nr:XRE family transcriptional regulator [Eggerthia catenaformis]